MKLLILDLDETLIHATEKPLERQADFTTELYYVYKRPYVAEFLMFCQKHFSVAVWTTAGEGFAEAVVKEVFSLNYPLKFLWSRERCTIVYNADELEYYFVKDLAKLKRKGYRLENVLMVDDTPAKLERHYGNLIRITAWLGDPNDSELLALREYLTELKDVANVRKVEKRGWQHRYA